jgi:hypothetical protein
MSSAVTLLVLSTTARSADYTGDGIDDLVVGVPYDSVGAGFRVGGIQVIRGSTHGLSTRGDAFIHQNTPGVVGRNDELEHFGYALGAGDLDGDGTDEVVVGATAENVGGFECGAIWQLDLTPTTGGLEVASSQLFSQETVGVDGTAEEFDYFGSAIAVADFDGDGYEDVVVGVPGEDVGSVNDAGAVQYLRGGPTGLTASGQIAYNQDSADVTGGAEPDDFLGTALAAGDFDADGYADLAIGASGEDWTGNGEGAVQVMYGTSSGPGVVSPNDELWTAGEGSAAGTLQDGNNCGSALAVGDFDGDGYDDLAIGCQSYDLGSATGAGAVLVVYGSAAGLGASELWSQDVAGVIGGAEDDDRFGAAVTAGDYDGDGYGDLAVAAPGEDYGSFESNGVVHVLLGSSGGLTDLGNVLLSQDTGMLVFGTPADSDEFGEALTSGDYDGDGLDDLAVGTKGDPDGGSPQGGVVNVFPGSAFGPSTTGDRWFHQDLPGMDDSVESADWFGFSVR